MCVSVCVSIHVCSLVSLGLVALFSQADRGST